jgi:hypothetical protein
MDTFREEKWDEVLANPPKGPLNPEHISFAIRKCAPLDVLKLLLPYTHMGMNRFITQAVRCNNQPALEWILTDRSFDPTYLLEYIIKNCGDDVPLDFIYRVLCMKGFNIKHRDFFGLAFVHMAIERSKYEVAILIVIHYPSCATLAIADVPPPMFYIKKWDEALELVTCLIENGHDPNARSSHGQTILHFANNIPVIRFLVEKAGANVFAKTDHGIRPSQQYRDGRYQHVLRFYEKISCLLVFCSTMTVGRIGRKSPIRVLPVEMFRELKRYLV